MAKFPRLLIVCLAVSLCLGGSFTRAEQKQISISGSVTKVPDDVRKDFKLSDFYEKHVAIGGLPIVASGKVSDYALLETAWVVQQMLGERQDVIDAIVRARIRLAVMSPSELTTDIPEHSDLTPKSYWDRRARGLGATKIRPAVSCGEENVLNLPGDPYRAENILIHEFAHVVHEIGMKTVDPTFDKRLRAVFKKSTEAGLWKKTYAASNPSEYWAEGVQSWFDCNRKNDSEHNDVDTREKLKEYDADLAALLAEVFRDNDWRYTRTDKRPDAPHLKGLDRAKLPRFAWPKELEKAKSEK